MQISSESVNDVRVVRLEGNLDTNTSTDAQDFLTSAMDDGESKIIVNFEKVDFVSSAGLRVLLATAKRLGGSGGNLRVCGLNETVSEVFEISGFSTLFNIHATADEALGA